jgi:hypothetical protein
MCDFVPGKDDSSGVNYESTGDSIQQRGFSGAVGAEHDEK